MKPHYLLLHIVLICFCGFPDCGATTCHSQDQAPFQSVKEYLLESVNQGHVAGGCLLVFHNGKVVFQTGFGYADITTKSPFRLDTPAVVASISKPLLGTSLFRLAEKGKLELNAPITRYLPEFTGRKLESGIAVKRPPTICELLTHSSGLRHDDAKQGRIWFQRWTKDRTLKEVVKTVAEEFPFVSQPGKRFAYSGIGTEVAARVGEVASGQSRNSMLRTHLCEPLGMQHTFYLDEEGIKRLTLKMPTRYYRSKTSGKLVVSRKRPLPRKDRYSSSGGTIVSTATDLLKWLVMIRNEGIGPDGRVYLTRDQVSRMLRENRIGRIADGGLFIRGRDASRQPVLFGHSGSSGTDVWLDLRTDTIAILLTQTRGSDIRDFRIELQRRISNAISDRKPTVRGR